MKFPLDASQTIAVIAIAAALAAGAYALGRSQTVPAPAPAVLDHGVPAGAAASAALLAQLPAPSVEEAKLAKADAPSQPASEPVAAKPAAPVLCAGCLRVVSVHTEQRKAESGSGAGAVGGAVIGGLLGNRVGGGTGRKLATLGGAVAGGYAGNEIEKNVNKKQVWIVELKSADGHLRHRELSSDPQLQAGDIVSLRDGHLIRR